MTSLWRAFQALIPLGVVVAIIMLGVAFAWRRLSPAGRRRAAIGFTGSWALAALAVTLRPQPDMIDEFGNPRSRWIDLIPSAEIRDSLFHSVSWHVAVEQVAGNIALFFPLGVGIAMLRWRRASALRLGFVAGAVAGFIIELMQWALGVGRVSSVDDIVLASLGCGLGFLASRPLVRAGSTPSEASTVRP